MTDARSISERMDGMPPVETGHALAQALGWGGESASYVETPDNLTKELRVTRTFFRGEPAVLFASTSHRAENDTDPKVLKDAALAAYHASIDWGALAEPQGLTVFHSRWIRNRDWYRLPRLPWARLEEHHLLEALSPEGITSGALQRIAAHQFYVADEYLRPVDEELVRRLDQWRRRALSIAPTAVGVDDALQLLFAQFFVLRAVEDRQLAPGLTPLREALSNRPVNKAVLLTIFDQARDRIQSELFASAPSELIADEVIAGVIDDLYVPRHLPMQARYNFAWLDADVLGRAYEKYLSRVLEPLSPADQHDLFGTVRRLRERDVRRQEGVYYTPTYLVRSLVAQALDPVLKDPNAESLSGPVTPSMLIQPLVSATLTQPSPTPDQSPSPHQRLPVIADFACGSGGFLVAAADYLLRQLRQRDSKRAWAHELVTGRHLIGVDKDARAVTLTRLNLYIRLTSEPESLPLPSLERCIIQGNSLQQDIWKDLPHEYDVVLGNPPFIATGNQPSREELTKSFQTAQGRFDFAYLFVELAIRRLRAHGVLGLVVPNRLFRNRDAGQVRSLLTSEADLLCIMDFGSQEVFKGVGAYIGTVTARRRATTDPEATTCRVVNVLATEEVAFLGALLTRAAEEVDPVRNDVLEAFQMPHPRGVAPWMLLTPEKRARRLNLAARSIPLGEVALLRQGIRTGANDIFIFEIESADEGFARVTNLAGDSSTLETALLRPVVFGAGIQRFDTVSPTRYILYPYHRGSVIEEPELKERYPKTFEYLERYREALASRGSLDKTGGRWYELIWKRDQAWLEEPKLVIRDLMVDAAFAIDEAGGTYLVGGTAVIPSNIAHLWPLLGYLNTQLVTDYLRQSTPAFRGGFQKVEPRHIEAIPVPLRLLRDSAVAQAVDDAARRAVRAKAAGREGDLHECELEIEHLIEGLLSGPEDMEDTDDDHEENLPTLPLVRP